MVMRARAEQLLLADREDALHHAVEQVVSLIQGPCFFGGAQRPRDGVRVNRAQSDLLRPHSGK